MTPVDELVPFPEDDDMSPSRLAADITAADERERTALEQRLIDVGFDEVNITEEGVDIWRFDLVLRGRDFDGSEAFGFLDGILEQSSLVLDQSTLEMEIARTLTTASFLCLRSHDSITAFGS